MKRALLILTLSFLAGPAWSLTLWGIDINGVEVQTGYVLILNSVGDSAPDPLVNTLGISIPFRFLTSFTFRPEVQIFFQGYGYENDRAVPLESMFDNVTILSLLFNPNFGMEFPFGPLFSVYGEGGLAFIARIPVFLNGDTAGSMALPVSTWFLAGRFLYPNVGAGFSWQFSPLFAITMRAQLFYPIFDLWGGLPWWDELSTGVNVGVRFTF